MGFPTRHYGWDRILNPSKPLTFYGNNITIIGFSGWEILVEKPNPGQFFPPA